MGKRIFIGILFVALIGLVPKVNAADEKKVSHQQLFKSKCSTCHAIDRAKKKHGTEKDFAEIIKKMIGKGAKVEDDEAIKIAEFLGAPSRFLFEEKCTKCHTLDRIIQAHKNGTLTKDTIKTMKKKGADITEEEIESIYDAMGKYYQFVSPMPVGSPGIR